MKTSLKADIGLLIVTLCWGISYILIDVCLEELSNMGLNAVRFLVAFAIAYPCAFKKMRHPSKETIKYAFIVSAILTVVYITATYGVMYTSLSNCGFLNGLSTVFTPIVGYFIFKQIFFSGNLVWLAGLIILWLFFFMSMLQSITGYVSFFVVALFILIVLAFKSKTRMRKVLYSVLSIAFPLAIFILISIQVRDFYTPTSDNIQLDKTANGIPYDNVKSDGTIENGNYVWMNVSRRELEQSWPKYSSIPLDSLDLKGQYIYPTLIRYMASKGLTKDAEGLSKLTPDDIRNVEKGETNYRFLGKGGLKDRLYVIIWEFDVYRKTGEVNGHSVTQRIEFLKYGCKLVGRNFWFGTGVGDVNDEYISLYEEESSSLLPEYRHRAHNQFLTFFVAFGIFGFLICLFAWFYPALSGIKDKNYYFCIFFIIATVSMFSDDTLETSTGAVFVAYFFSLLKWTKQKKDIDGELQG